MYIRMTNAESTEQSVTSGTRTLLSSMRARARLALPVSVAAVFFSR